MPRLYREAPLYSIWEGSGNVICLDILRAIAKEPNCLAAILHEIRLASGADRRLSAYFSNVESVLHEQAAQSSPTDSERGARSLAEKTALALQASLIVRYSPSAVADAFCASRIAGNCGHTFGTLPKEANIRSIIDAVCSSLPT